MKLGIITSTIRGALCLIVGFALVVGPASLAEAKEPKAPKAADERPTLCFLTTLYFGSVDAASKHQDLAHVCKKVSASDESLTVAACTSQGAERCEVTGELGRYTIEQKLVVAK